MAKNETNALALAELGSMDHEELTEVAGASLEKNLSQKSKIDELVEEHYALTVGDAFPLDEMAGTAAGAASAGLVMGDLQRRIDAGEEGFDEDSNKLLKVLDYDLAMGVTAAVGSYVAHRAGARKERAAPGSGKDTLAIGRMLRGFASGAASGALYRLAYKAAVTADDPEDEEETAEEESDQAAV